MFRTLKNDRQMPRESMYFYSAAHEFSLATARSDRRRTLLRARQRRQPDLRQKIAERQIAVETLHRGIRAQIH